MHLGKPGIALLTSSLAAILLFGQAVSMNRDPIQTYVGDENLEGMTNATYFGSALAGAADVDASGNDFLLVGAPKYSHSVAHQGMAYLYSGDLSDGTASKQYLGHSAGALDDFGSAVALVDLFTDGSYPDLIIGAPNSASPGSHAGKAMLFLGSTVESGSSTASSPLTEHAFLKPANPEASARFGAAITSLGYYDEDSAGASSYGDVAIGAPSEVTSDSGRVYVFLGASSAPSSGSTVYPDKLFRGEQSNDRFGRAIAGGRDLDGDDYADFLVAAHQYDTAMDDDIGRVYLFTGAVEHRIPNVVDAGTFDDYGHSTYITGENEDDSFGYSVALIGDVNGDGDCDYAVTTSYSQQSDASVYVFLGGADAPTGALAAATTASMRIDDIGFTLPKVAGVGDVNLDGFDDFVVHNEYARSGKGDVLVFYGGHRYAPYDDELVTVDAADIAVDYIYEPVAIDHFGTAVVALGDTNEDGLPDFAVGAEWVFNSALTPKIVGAVYVFDSSLMFEDDTAGTISSGWSDEHAPFAVAAIDFNGGEEEEGAGGVDVLVTFEAHDATMFKNDGYVNNTEQLKFLDATGAAFVAGEAPGSGCRGISVADIDNDGLDDMFIAHATAPRLYKNLGAGDSYRFDDQLSGAGSISMSGADSSWAAAWGDYDRDGFVDLYVVRSGGTHTHDGISGKKDKLFRSTGWTAFGFDDVTEDPGMGLLTSTTKSSSATWADVDGDGNLDLYVTGLSSGEPGTFYLNMADGTFEDRTDEATGPTIGEISYATGSSWIDLDRDGDLDMVVSRVDPGSSADNLMTLENDGTGRLASESFGVATSEKMIGVVAGDLDLNGVVDVLGVPESSTVQPPLFAGFHPSGNGVTYVDRGAEFGVASGASQGITIYDHDGDGDLELFRGRSYTSGSLEGVVLEGRRSEMSEGSAPAATWLGLDLEPLSDGGNNASAIGSVIKVRVPDSDSPYYEIVRTVSGAGGRFGQESRIQHFGFGEVEDDVKVTVTWPDGYEQSAVYKVGHATPSLKLNATQVFAEVAHDPDIVPGSFAFHLQAVPGQKVDWVISWKTTYNSDPDSLTAKVWSNKNNGPSCYSAGTAALPLTLSAGGSVKTSVTPVEGGYRNEVRWIDRPCVMSCKYGASTPYSEIDGESDTSSESSSATQAACLQ